MDVNNDVLNRCILAITLAIYLRSGTTIYRKHRQLRKFQGSSSGGVSSINRGNGGANLKTTEVTVTSEVMRKSETLEMQTMGNQTTAGVSSTTQHARNSSMSIYEEQQKQTSTQTATNTTMVSTNADTRPPRRIYQEVNNAAWQYTKCALLFFIVIVITWLPSSANRVYSYIHPGKANVTLQFMSATVLPLQGFWNAVIYAFTSGVACKKLFNKWRETLLEITGRGADGNLDGGMGRPSWVTPNGARSAKGMSSKLGTVIHTGAARDTESMRGLAKSLHGSDDGHSESFAAHGRT